MFGILKKKKNRTYVSKTKSDLKKKDYFNVSNKEQSEAQWHCLAVKKTISITLDFFYKQLRILPRTQVA